MTRLTVAGALDMEYRYSATENNGQINAAERLGDG